MNVYARNRLMDIENRLYGEYVLYVHKGEGRAEGQIWGMGLTDTNYCI